MEAVALYLLKMCLCSALLFGYYRVALYNEKFHQWNRFYLLAAMVLSVIIPLVNIPLAAIPPESKFANTVAFLPWHSSTTLVSNNNLFNLTMLSYVSVAITVCFLLKMVISITRLIKDSRANPSIIIHHNIKLVFTQLSQAPFSFFKHLFWRHDVDPSDANSQRILRHELTHIRERHSIDKLFTTVVTAVFWMNPFFWFIAKELNMIHEFLADRKAVGPHNGPAFAAMILQASFTSNTINNTLINPFLSSQIKRRLFMITTSKRASFSYVRRVSGLGLMVSAALALTLSIQQADAQQSKKSPTKPAVEQSAVKGTPAVTPVNKARVKSSEKDSLKFNRAGSSTKVVRTLKDDQINAISITSEKDQTPPIYFVDGEEWTAGEMKKVKPSAIKAVNVLKGEHALAKYGSKGEHGVIEITLKSAKEQAVTEEKKIVTIQTTPEKLNLSSASPLYLVDGKFVDAEKIKDIHPDTIESINVLKGETATKKYGTKGKDGVIEISLKKPVT